MKKLMGILLAAFVLIQPVLFADDTLLALEEAKLEAEQKTEAELKAHQDQEQLDLQPSATAVTAPLPEKTNP